jgi:UDP-glucuronate 4-epimerase
MPDPAERILLTGAAGFIGSHTVERLLGAGCTVIGVDNFDRFYDPAIKRRNLAEVARHPGASRLTVIEADLCDADAMAKVFEEHRPTGVIHLAARAGVRPSIEQPALYALVNVEGTTVMLEAARRTKECTRFVMASSSSVYGNNPKVPFAESDDVNAPISPYAATKRSCELIAHTYTHLYKLPIACLRFFTVFGPRQRPDLAIGKFIRLVSRGEPIPFFGDGSTSRDYTFIEDIVTGVLAAYDRIPHHGYRIWNLGGSDPVTLREMVDTIGRVVGKTPNIQSLPLQPGDVERTFADLTRSTAELGFRPTTAFQDGVRRQWDWFRALP